MKFTKMVAAGNDFVVFNGLKYHIEDYGTLAKRYCHRHFSVGADGILVCEKSDVADIKMVYYNSDGSEGEMCGNGIRCFSKYAYEEGLVDKDIFQVETLAGIKTIWLESNDEGLVKSIKVNMGKPNFNPKDIPVDIEKDKAIEETIEIDGEEFIYSAVLMGVPHLVIFVDHIDGIDINGIGRKLENHPLFPAKINVNFVKLIDRDKINIYTWERGAGRTLGCGTGSCASVVIGNYLGKLDERVLVKTEGGKLEVELGKDGEVYMKGDATRICDGIFSF